MKTILKTVFVIISFIALYGNTRLNAQELYQTTEPKLSDKLSISPSIGWLHSWGDFRTEDVMPNFLKSSENELGYSLRLNYEFSEVLRFSAGVLAGKLVGNHEMINTTGAVNEPSDLGLGVQYRTNIFQINLPRVDFNATRFIFKDRSKVFNKVSVNLFLSHGLIFFDSKVYAMQSEDIHLLYGKHRGRSGRTTEAVTTFGSELAYLLNDQFDLNLGIAIGNVWNDRLDAWESRGSFNDKYSYLSAGVTYYIKKRSYVVKDFGLEEDALVKNEASETEDVKKGELDEKEEIAEDTGEIQTQNEIEDKEVENVLDEPLQKVDQKPEPEANQRESIVPKDNSSGNEYELNEERGMFVIVSAFKTLERARQDAKNWEEKEEVMIVRNRINTWYLVSIARYDDKESALKRMREARQLGYEGSWVLLKP